MKEQVSLHDPSMHPQWFKLWERIDSAQLTLAYSSTSSRVTGSSRSALSDGSWIKPSFSPDSNSLTKSAVPYQNHEQQEKTKEDLPTTTQLPTKLGLFCESSDNICISLPCLIMKGPKFKSILQLRLRRPLLNALWHLKNLHLKHLWNEKPSLTWNKCCQTGGGSESMHPQNLTVPCGIYPVTFNWRVRDQ
jgi:hypothetical protein